MKDFKCDKCGLVARDYGNYWVDYHRRYVSLDGGASAGFGVGCSECKEKLVVWFRDEVMR